MSVPSATPTQALLQHTLDFCDECLGRDDLTGAAHALNRAVALAPNRADLLIHRGRLAAVLGDSDLSRRDFTEAIRLEPSSSEALSALACHHLRQGAPAEAKAAADRAMAINPSNKEADHVKAQVQFETSRTAIPDSLEPGCPPDGHLPLTAAEVLAETTIILPTKGRRERAQAFLKVCQHRPLLLVVNADRAAEDTPEHLLGAEVITCGTDIGPVQAGQAGIVACKTRYFFCANDDLEWSDDGPLHEAARVYAEQLGPKDGVVGMNDLEFGAVVACFALISRAFYMEHMHPVPYLHYYVDNEWTIRAKRLGVWAYAEKAVVRHLKLTKQQNDWFLRDMPFFKQRFNLTGVPWLLR